MTPKVSKGFLFALGTSMLWAVVIVISRFLLQNGENPLNLVVWINIIALPIWVLLFQRHKQEFKILSRRNKLLLLCIGILGSLGINYLQSLALDNTSAINFAFLYRTIVVFTIVFAWIFFKEKITVKKLVVAGIIIVGSYFLTTGGQSLEFEKGDIYTLMMAASTAFIANILIKHTVSKMNPDLSAAAIMIVTTGSLLILAIITHQIAPPQGIFLICLTGIISVFQTRFRNRAYKLASASFVTMIVSFTPVFVSLLSYPLLGESLDGIQIVGGICIVSAGVFAEKLKI